MWYKPPEKNEPSPALRGGSPACSHLRDRSVVYSLGCSMKIHLVTALALVFATQVHAEQDCRLKRVAVLTLSREAGGDYTIPLTIGGKEQQFILGLNAPYSAVSGSIADAEAYETHKLPDLLRPVIGHETVDTEVVVPDFQIGPVHAKNYHMFRAASGMGRDHDLAGLAGLDILEKFDVDLDLKNARLTLFSQDHCEGQVVYWADDYAVVPFTIDKSGHIAFAMQLDGKKLSVDFDVSKGPALMPLPAAKRLFDLSETSPDMEKLQGSSETYYRFPFKSLSLDGVAVLNPAIVLYPASGPECRPDLHFVGGRESRCFGMSDMRLRADELDKLRLFFAFKEKTLYATAADAGGKTP